MFENEELKPRRNVTFLPMKRECSLSMSNDSHVAEIKTWGLKLQQHKASQECRSDIANWLVGL